MVLRSTDECVKPVVRPAPSVSLPQDHAIGLVAAHASLMRPCAGQAHVEREQMDCHLTRTTAETHKLIQENLAETPVYGGWVDSKGPRYCPSIEDKIVRFADKTSHQVLLCS